MRNVHALMITAACLAVVGCASSGWQPRTTSWRAQNITLLVVADPGVYCPKAPPGSVDCTVRINESRSAIIYVRAGLTADQHHCALHHGFSHAMGLDHSRDAPYMCGAKAGL